MLTFVGAIVIGSLLIPMGIMGLYVAQKFPNRSPQARTKSRIMVIFVFLIFHCLVAVLAEVNTWWLELVTVIATLVGGVLGFLLIIIPMNKWDWKISSQVLLSLFMAVYLLACLAGWAYLMYQAVLNNIACGQAATNLATTVLNLPSFGVPGSLQQLVPVCSQTEYSHSIIVAIFAGTGCIMTLMGGFFSIVLAGKIACGTPLNLGDSDYELD